MSTLQILHIILGAAVLGWQATWIYRLLARKTKPTREVRMKINLSLLAFWILYAISGNFV